MFAIFPGIAACAALIGIIFFGQPIVEAFLASILFFVVGFGSLFAFMGHIFNSNEVAKKIGWPSGNPFQFEVGIANLSYGVLGIMCMWFRNEFWIAAVVAVSIFYIGAGICHISDKHKNKNVSELNVGFPLYFDFILPIVLIVLLCLYLAGC